MRHWFVMLILASAAGTAGAQNQFPWDGIHGGLNIGGATNKTCDEWSFGTASANGTALANRSCPDNTALVGGLQIGDDFQFNHLVVGVELDLEGSNSGTHNQTFSSMGPVPPGGTYAFSGKFNPSTFVIVGPRFGFATPQWLVYVKAGSLIAFGTHDSTLTYTPPGGVVPVSSFSGGKDFTSTGWAAGGGAEWGLNGAWSIKLEFLHANLGNGSNSVTQCTGSAVACAAFSGISLDSTHNSFTADIVRIGFNYWFGYWSSP
jgi:opacity protein-like surface antigen